MNDSKTNTLELTGEERQTLTRYGFDEETFTRLRGELTSGSFPPERNQTSDPVAPPEAEDLIPWPERGSEIAEKWEALGKEAIAAGQVGAVILNGGMATRFGGMVKGVVEVLDDHSFLDLKLSRLSRAGSVEVFVMSSFATIESSTEHIENHRWFGLDPDHAHHLVQKISLRLQRDGYLHRDPAGRASFYAPGHGDIFEVLAASPAFTRFREAGGRLIMISNVDNLGATLNPRVVGAHLAHENPVTVEVAERSHGDKGGAPVRHRGRVEVLEGFRFPEDFDISGVPVFNTNTLLVDVKAVRPDYDLTWFRADKIVDDSPVVQFERLMGEITAFLPASYLSVPRNGPEGRFLPVKTPDDLVSVRPAVRDRFGL